MSINSLTIPSTYARLIIELCAARGIDIAAAARRLDRQVLDDPDGRFPLLDVGGLLYQAFLRDEAIGYEIGLNTQLTSHGFVGYGLLTHPTFGDALAFGLRNADLRTPFVTLSTGTQDGVAHVEVRESFELGPARQVCIEHFLIGIWRIAALLAQTSGLREVGFELHFAHPEPRCHAQYRSRLPPCHFSAAVNQLRFPAASLALPLATADDTAARLAARQCASERNRAGAATTVTARVQALLEELVTPPGLAAVAARLHLSDRSLKRKLRQEGSSYQRLVDRHRERIARLRLRDPHLSIGDIAAELGYTAPANFTRAFRKWTGQSPSALRDAGRRQE